MAQSSHPQDYPPSIHHKSTYLDASAAVPILSTFLEATRKAPHLHPDALLLSEGVKHGPKSGPSGGIAIHHLRRIEAGLRGEHLEVESKDELRAQFGEEAVPLEIRHNLPGAAGDEDAKPGDDTRLDEIIEEGEYRRQKETRPPAEESEKAKRKREKKERTEREKANKRKLDEADEGNQDEEAKEGAAAPSEEKPRKKARKDHASAPETSAPVQAPVAEEKPKKKKAKKENPPTPAREPVAEPTKATAGAPATEEKPRKKKSKKDAAPGPAAEPEPPVKKESSPPPPAKKKSKKDNPKVKQEPHSDDNDIEMPDLPVKKEELLSQQEYEQSQKPLEGEVGERNGAPMVRQDGAPPVIVKHDSKGNVKVPDKPKTDAEKAERKAAKKAKRAEQHKAQAG